MNSHFFYITVDLTLVVLSSVRFPFRVLDAFRNINQIRILPVGHNITNELCFVFTVNLHALFSYTAQIPFHLNASVNSYLFCLRPDT